MRGLRLAFLLLSAGTLLVAAPALAQHLEVFDVEDFVDPSLLELLSQKADARAFGALTLIAGGGRDFERWSEVAKGDFQFTHLAGDLYTGRWQLGFDALQLDPKQAGSRFGDRLGLRIGHYSTSEIPGESGQPAVRMVDRTHFEWQVERRPGGGLGHELTVGLDLRRDGPRTSIIDVVGGFSYTWVQAAPGDQGHDRHYVSFGYRSPITAYSNGVVFSTGFGYGAENTLGRFRWGAVRLELTSDFPIRPLRSKIRLSWAPVYQLDRGELHHELAVVFLPPIVSHIFSRSPTARR